jgi:hypothetical protein
LNYIGIHAEDAAFCRVGVGACAPLKYVGTTGYECDVMSDVATGAALSCCEGKSLAAESVYKVGGNFFEVTKYEGIHW